MNNREILNKLNETVYGHERAKKALITVAKRAKTRYERKMKHLLNVDAISPLNCLLVGGSGTGKTFLIESLAKIMDFPYMCIDATGLSPTGNSDGINATKLKKLIVEKARTYITPTSRFSSIEGVLDQMIVFVDEIDKLANAFESSGKWNSHVQSNFLTLIDDKNEWGGVSWVFAGAFSEIERTTTTEALGFTSDKEVVTKVVTDEDIIKGGLIPELVGRIGVIESLDVFDEVDYTNILNELLLPKKYEQLRQCNVVFNVLTEEEITDISGAASDSGQGVRGVQRKLDSRYLEEEFDAEETLYLEEKVYEQITHTS